MNELVVQENKEVATQPEGILAQRGLTVDDIRPTRLLIMQGSSEAVGAGKCKNGDMVLSTDETIVGAVDKPLHIIPFHQYTTWLTYDVSQGGTPKFLRIEPRTPQLDAKYSQQKYTGMENGKAVKYYRTMNFVCLLASECVEDGEPSPVIVSFKSTSAKAGGDFANMLLKGEVFSKEWFDKVYVLSTTRVKKDTNTFAVLSVAPLKVDGKDAASSPFARKAAKMWLSMFKTKPVMLEEADIQLEETAPKAPEVVVVGNAINDIY